MRNWFVALVVLLIPYGLLFGMDDEKTGDIDLRKVKTERGESVFFHKGSSRSHLSVHKDARCKAIDGKSPAAPMAGLLFVEKGGEVKRGIMAMPASAFTISYCACSEQKPELSRAPLVDLHAVDMSKGTRVWICKGKVGELIVHGRRCDSVREEITDSLIISKDKESHILSLAPEDMKFETCTACYKDKAAIVDELIAASKMEKYIRLYQMNLMTGKDTSIDKNRFGLVTAKDLLKKVREKLLEDGEATLRRWHDAMRSAESWTDALDDIRATASLTILELAYSLK